jgi:hypothetical protein
MLNAQQFAEKHNRRLKGAIEDMRNGVAGVTTAPSTQAIAKKDKMIARLTESVNNGKWASNLQKVSLEDWKTQMIDKGLPRVAGGIDSARLKVEDFASQLLPAIESATSKIKAMPDLTLEDSINRMTTMVREMAKFRKK